MRRIARNYPKGKLKLRIPKTVQRDKKNPLYIEYNWQADSVRKSTGISVFVKDWNEKGYRRHNSWNNTINTALRALSHEMGWKQDLTFHIARHTWAVLAHARGAEISEISRLLGHTSKGGTERVYAEFLPDSLASVVGNLGFDFMQNLE